MFGFHKPKMYRSIEGCCICRAKSSSSHFTDSKRYEKDFQSCFWLHETRSGDICNACVLRVKRWKKLLAGSKKQNKTGIIQKIGCGIIYKGRSGEVLIDTRLFQPCCSNEKAVAEKPEEQGGASAPPHSGVETEVLRERKAT